MSRRRRGPGLRLQRADYGSISYGPVRLVIVVCWLLSPLVPVDVIAKLAVESFSTLIVGPVLICPWGNAGFRFVASPPSPKAIFKHGGQVSRAIVRR